MASCLPLRAAATGGPTEISAAMQAASCNEPDSQRMSLAVTIPFEVLPSSRGLKVLIKGIFCFAGSFHKRPSSGCRISSSGSGIPLTSTGSRADALTKETVPRVASLPSSLDISTLMVLSDLPVFKGVATTFAGPGGKFLINLASMPIGVRPGANALAASMQIAASTPPLVPPKPPLSDSSR